MWCTQAKLSSEHITSQLNFNLNYQPCNCALKDRSGFQVWKCLKYHPQCQICALELKINQCWFHNANITQVSCKKILTSSNFRRNKLCGCLLDYKLKCSSLSHQWMIQWSFLAQRKSPLAGMLHNTRKPKNLLYFISLLLCAQCDCSIWWASCTPL